MEQQYEEGLVYSAEDAIFDEDLYLSLQSSGVHTRPNPRKALIVLFSQRKDSQACYLHFLSKQLIREVVKFLNFPDFFAFTGTCRRYTSFLSDPYVDQHFPKSIQSDYLFPSTPTRKDIRESLLSARLQRGTMKTETYSFVRNKRTSVLHVQIEEGETRLYSAQDGVVWVWKLGLWGVEDVGMLAGLERIHAFAGHEDVIVVTDSREICLSCRREKQGLLLVPGLDSYSRKETWNYESIHTFKWCSAGSSLIALSEVAMRVLSFDLDVLALISFPTPVHFIHVEDPQASLLLTYHSSTLSVFNLRKSLTNPLTHLEISYVTSVRTLTVRTAEAHRDYIFTLTKQGHVYANRNLRITTEQVSEMVLFKDYLFLLSINRAKVEVFKPGLKQVESYKNCCFSSPLAYLVPTQEKLVAIHIVANSFAVCFFKYNSQTAFYSLPVSLSQVHSFALYGSLLLLQGISSNKEPCLLVLKMTVLCTPSQLSDYNALLREINPSLPAPLPEETTDNEVKRHVIEHKRPKKNKDRELF